MRTTYTSLVVTLLFALSIGSESCTVPGGSYQPKNVASIYNPGLSPLHPEFVVYHSDDEISQLYFRINTSELLFNDANPEKVNRARFSIHYRLYKSFASGTIVDSSRLEFTIPRPKADSWYTSNFPIAAKAGRNYSLELECRDELKHTVQLSYLSVEKEDSLSAQNFLLRDSSNMVLFNSYINKNQLLTIENRRLQADTLYLAYYQLVNDPPVPPFSMTKNRFHTPDPDTIQQLVFSGKTSLTFPKIGHYFISADSLLKSGKLINRFHRFYPETKTSRDLVEPLIYLSTKKEFRTLLQQSDTKLAVDSFWLDAAGNMYRARELIRVYYSRVFFANYYFSAFTEGWLSDRGMIYIIFGPPKTIYKSDVAERWIYGTDKNLSSMDFYFEKVSHPFSNSVYLLKRQEIYKASWYQAIDTWRNGRVYSVLN